MAGKTHWSRLVWGDVAAESLLVETFLHGSIQQALARVQAVYVGVVVVFQLGITRGRIHNGQLNKKILQ